MLVTGAASGVGAATARLIAERGGHAVACDRAGADVVLDLTVPGDWDAAIAATIARHGRLDGLVSSAGVAGSGSVVDLDLAEFRAAARGEVEGAFLGIQRVVAQLRRQGSPAHGSIVVVGSVLASVAAPDVASFAAAQAARANMARAIGVELGRKGDFIRVNVVAAGDPTRHDVPLRAPATPDDVAEAVLFLLSDDSSFMTASVTTIDGGSSL